MTLKGNFLTHISKSKCSLAAGIVRAEGSVSPVSKRQLCILCVDSVLGSPKAVVKIATNSLGLHPTSLSQPWQERGLFASRSTEWPWASSQWTCSHSWINHRGPSWRSRIHVCWSAWPQVHVWSQRIRSAPPNYVDWSWVKGLNPKRKVRVENACLAGQAHAAQVMLMHCIFEAFLVPPISGEPDCWGREWIFLSCDLPSVHIAGFCYLMGHSLIQRRVLR